MSHFYARFFFPERMDEAVDDFFFPPEKEKSFF